MIVILIVSGLAFALIGMLWLGGLKGPLSTMVAAAVLFGCAGFAYQGRPDLPGAPREQQDRPAPLSLADARRAMLGQFDASDSWLNMADALASRGKSEEAAKLLAAQVAKRPGDFKLWVGLGNALADHSQTLSPAARLAFQRAQELAPNSPAPAFFLGLAEARSGNPDEARRLWTAILADASPIAGWRPMVEDGLKAIGGGATPPPTAKDQAGS